MLTDATTHALQLNIVTFLAKRLFDTTKAAQAGNAGVPFKKVLEEARFLSLPSAKVNGPSSCFSPCCVVAAGMLDMAEQPNRFHLALCASEAWPGRFDLLATTRDAGTYSQHTHTLTHAGVLFSTRGQRR